MEDRKITIRISEELFKQFRIALITRNQTEQAVLEQAVRDYINPKEGNEMTNYKVYVGEVGNEQGHFVGSSQTLLGAKQIAGRELTDYAGAGWGKITNDATGERYGREGNFPWVGPF